VQKGKKWNEELEAAKQMIENSDWSSIRSSGPGRRPKDHFVEREREILRNVWVANFSSNNVTELSSSGIALGSFFREPIRLPLMYPGTLG